MNQNLSTEDQKLLEILNKQMAALRGKIDPEAYRRLPEYRNEWNNRLEAIFRYCITVRDDSKLAEYLALETEEERSRLIESELAVQLRIPVDDINYRKKEIFEAAYRNYHTNGFLLHSTNSYFVSQLEGKEYFGGTDELEHDKDVRRINDILNWHDARQNILRPTVDQERGFHFSDNANRILHYGSNGPEWFSRLCGNCADFEGVIFHNEKNAFERRDHDTARRNITAYMDSKRFLDGERTTILELFEKYWSKYGDSTPSLLLIPKRAVLDRSDWGEEFFDGRYETLKETYGKKLKALDFLSTMYMGRATPNHVFTDSIISVDILPLFPEIEKKVKAKDAAKSTFLVDPSQVNIGNQSVEAFKQELATLMGKIMTLNPAERKKVEVYIDSLIAQRNGVVPQTSAHTKKEEGWGYGE